MSASYEVFLVIGTRRAFDHNYTKFTKLPWQTDLPTVQNIGKKVYIASVRKYNKRRTALKLE